MRNHNKKINPLKTAAFFLEKMARWPLLTFLLFSAIGAAITVWFFFAFRNLDSSMIQEMPLNGTVTFDKSDIKKYNDVFSAMEQRETNCGQAASTTYPNVFKPAQKKAPQ